MTEFALDLATQTNFGKSVCLKLVQLKLVHPH